jgi:hypothetical protein
MPLGFDEFDQELYDSLAHLRTPPKEIDPIIKDIELIKASLVDHLCIDCIYVRKTVDDRFYCFQLQGYCSFETFIYDTPWEHTCEKWKKRLPGNKFYLARKGIRGQYIEEDDWIKGNYGT